MAGIDVRAILPELRRRVRADFTRAELAKASGVSDGHLSRLESGERLLTVDVARRLAPALEMTPRALFALLGFEAVTEADLALPSDTEQELRVRTALRDYGVPPDGINSLMEILALMRQGHPQRHPGNPVPRDPIRGAHLTPREGTHQADPVEQGAGQRGSRRRRPLRNR